MTFAATWSVLAPDSSPDGGELTVRTAGDVATLVAELGKPGATAAMIYHDRRPTVPDGADGHVPDHDMTAGIRQGYGYLSYVDDTHEFAVTDGDPDSPAFPADYVEYPAGSGITVDLLRAALAEFLDTATARPTCDGNPSFRYPSRVEHAEQVDDRRAGRYDPRMVDDVRTRPDTVRGDVR